MDRRAVDASVVASLLADQYPQWAHLPLTRVVPGGWDNETFRLGDEWLLRLPSAEVYVAQVVKEHHWLPVLARCLPLQVPEPVAMGRPSEGFPWPWSIYRWIDGETASDGCVDMTSFASELAEFLAALHEIDVLDGPPAGEHNFFRGGPLGIYDTETRQAIQLLASDSERDVATEVWEAAIASRWERSPVWVHGDVTPSNLIVSDGQLRAVIDFGCAGVGDPACDLVIAWTFLTVDGREAFRHRLKLDEATWARGRGWALWKALITLAREEQGGEPATQAARRFGWRGGPKEVLNRILTDHMHPYERDPD
jgi:aminoglycoside phosphotransferase (APT) family kinase protein